MRGQLSRTVLRGLGGSNAPPATRLAGYEVREYLLEKWKRACTYCGAQNVPLPVEHIQAKAKGGTDRISNLCLACDSCNQAKGTQDIRVFLTENPDLLGRILAQTKAPLADAAAVNTIRWALYERLKTLGMPIECGSGGLTKFNRTVRALPKKHWLDAVCVGKSTPQQVHLAGVVPLLITATGHGSRQKCNVNELGFPRSKPKGTKKVKGFQTGISSAPSSPAAPNKAFTLDRFWCGQVDRLTSARTRAEYRGSAIASVLRFIDAMAIVT